MSRGPLEEITYITLGNGVQLPRIGLGTFKAHGDSLKATVVHAIEVAGITHIDTAAVYKAWHRVT
jgi:diketogulonate reductase-like aldo/keto reductase